MRANWAPRKYACRCVSSTTARAREAAALRNTNTGMSGGRIVSVSMPVASAPVSAAENNAAVLRIGAVSPACRSHFPACGPNAAPSPNTVKTSPIPV